MMPVAYVPVRGTNGFAVAGLVISDVILIVVVMIFFVLPLLGTVL